MALKPNGVFGKDVQLFIDDNVSKIVKGDIVGITEDGTGVLATTDGTLAGTTSVVGVAQVNLYNDFNKSVYSNYGPDHRYLASETGVVTYVNVEAGVSIKPGDALYVSKTEAGKATNVLPANAPTAYDAAKIDEAMKVNQVTFIGVALDVSVEGQVLVSLMK